MVAILVIVQVGTELLVSMTHKFFVLKAKIHFLINKHENLQDVTCFVCIQCLCVEQVPSLMFF